MKRGEVWWVEFSSAPGGEIRKQRPTVIVSNDASNKHLNRLQVVPLSSKIAKVYPCEAIIKIRGKAHKAMADQITTVSKSRLSNKMGSLNSEDLQNVEKIIKIQLNLR